MKALSIKEPWASLILGGKKTIETRSWKTDFRGWLLLCCSKRPTSRISGCAFATATLLDCRPMIKENEGKAMCKLYPDAYSWILSDIEPIIPFKVKGKLRLFDVDIDVNLEDLKRFP